MERALGETLRISESKNGYDNQARLLRTAGSAAQGVGEGNSWSVSQTRAQISSRSESGRQVGGRKIQADTGSVRRSVGHEEASDVRPVWIQRAWAGRRAAARSGLWRGAGRHSFRFRRM